MQPERRTRLPLGLGPLYYLCPKCKGSGGDSMPRPKLFEVKSKEAPPGLPPVLRGPCPRCDGKGMVLEDHSGR